MGLDYSQKSQFFLRAQTYSHKSRLPSVYEADEHSSASFQEHSLTMRGVPQRDRAEFWRETFGRHIARINIEPRDVLNFDASAMIRGSPRLRLLRLRSRAAVSTRALELLSDGDRALALLIGGRSEIRLEQCGRSSSLTRFDCTFLRHDEHAKMEHGDVSYSSIVLPMEPLLDRGVEVDELPLRRERKNFPALKML